jgi:hypothetical protein
MENALLELDTDNIPSRVTFSSQFYQFLGLHRRPVSFYETCHLVLPSFYYLEVTREMRMSAKGTEEKPTADLQNESRESFSVLELYPCHENFIALLRPSSLCMTVVASPLQ